jgi:hypothetical protein
MADYDACITSLQAALAANPTLTFGEVVSGLAASLGVAPGDLVFDDVVSAWTAIDADDDVVTPPSYLADVGVLTRALDRAGTTAQPGRVITELARPAGRPVVDMRSADLTRAWDRITAENIAVSDLAHPM